MVAVTGALVALVAVKLAILPDPAAARPIEVLLFVQLYTTVPPVAGLVKLTADVVEFAHNVWLATGFTIGVGLTVIVNVIAGPVQVVPALV